MKSCKAKITVHASPKRIVASIYDALAPDLSTMPAKGCRTAISLRETDIVFKMQASDISSLRACLNSHLRLTDVSYKCLSV